MIQKKEIDSGTGFDWGRISGDYAKYRDIYPEEFYQRLLDRGVCTLGQDVLDIGTGTGVIPRNLYSHGARFTGIDISMPVNLAPWEYKFLGITPVPVPMSRTS